MNLKSERVGILGVGTYLPPEIRKNDWWPESVVAGWIEKRDAAKAKHPPQEASTPGMARVLAAMEKGKDDPFGGALERRVMPAGMKPSDMEVQAANEALDDAAVESSEIDLLLSFSAVPDQLVTNNACLLQDRLGLPAKCFAMSMDAACNSFLLQMSVAAAFLASGRARKALLVQSCGISRMLDVNEPGSPWFGDGATAVVVGPVGEGKGMLAAAHRTDGRFNDMVVGSVRGARWYDDGRVVMYSADPRLARQSFLEIADVGKEVADEVLATAGYQPKDVAFFGVHQGTPWLREVTHAHFGLENAATVDTFRWAASPFACNIPLGFAVGRKEGLLHDGDLVLMFAGGAGLSYSSILLRWGR